MQRIVLASGNRGKLAELKQLLGEHAFEVIAQSELQIPDAEETGLSFVENAILKARNAAQQSGLPALADDSGLEVDALHGAPGIYSARYAGLPSSDTANNDKLLEALADVPAAKRGARYQCVLVYMRHAHDPSPLICQGTWEGEILAAPRGAGGFGYDPLFYVPALHRTAAELPAAQKNQLSHRGQALRLLLAAPARANARNVTATVRVALSDGAHFTAAADEDLLTAAQRAHWLVRHGCRNGNCEACAATLLQGRIRHRDGRLIEATASAICLCLSYAQSDVRIALPSDPLPGSLDRSQRCYAQLQRQSVAEDASTLYFKLPAGRSPAVLEGQIALIETDGGSLQVAIDHTRSQGRELVVRLTFASPLAVGAYYHVCYPLCAAPL